MNFNCFDVMIDADARTVTLEDASISTATAPSSHSAIYLGPSGVARFRFRLRLSGKSGARRGGSFRGHPFRSEAPRKPLERPRLRLLGPTRSPGFTRQPRLFAGVLLLPDAVGKRGGADFPDGLASKRHCV